MQNCIIISELSQRPSEEKCFFCFLSLSLSLSLCSFGGNLCISGGGGGSSVGVGAFFVCCLFAAFCWREKRTNDAVSTYTLAEWPR